MDQITLHVEEHQHSGVKYFTVQPYCQIWNYDRTVVLWKDIETWCHRTYGPKGNAWYGGAERWYVNNSRIWFRDEKDLTMFVMRWS